jgi:hypothetical protein
LTRKITWTTATISAEIVMLSLTECTESGMNAVSPSAK